MSWVVISDTHLTSRFDNKLFSKLKVILTQADRIILNGDFWDAYLCTFDDFIKSEWSTTLFPILKKKKTIYVIGNHDKKEFMDDRYKFFADKLVDKYDFKSGNKTITIQHGHLISPGKDRFPLTRNPELTRFFYKIIVWLSERFPIVDNLIYKLIEENSSMRAVRRIRRYISKNSKKADVFIFGHTHFEFYEPENKFYMAALDNNLKSYFVVENGKISLEKM